MTSGVVLFFVRLLPELHPCNSSRDRVFTISNIDAFRTCSPAVLDSSGPLEPPTVTDLGHFCQYRRFGGVKATDAISLIDNHMISERPANDRDLPWVGDFGPDELFLFYGRSFKKYLALLNRR